MVPIVIAGTVGTLQVEVVMKALNPGFDEVLKATRPKRNAFVDEGVPSGILTLVVVLIVAALAVELDCISKT